MPSQGTVVQSENDGWAYQDRLGTTDSRFALASLVAPKPDTSLVAYRSGVFPSGDTGGVGGSGHMAMRVRPGAGLSVTVEAGNCLIDTAGNGPYMCTLGSQKTLSLAAASPSNNRIDLVIARVYDDQNSAIGSPSGVRKFTVEVWTGDNSSGTPVEPTPTPTAGWIPLAAIYVAAGATSISAANITDKRGPTAATRGMRALYGADAIPGSSAFEEPGAYPGDQRWVHNALFQHQVYYGSQDGWRGVFNCKTYHEYPQGSNSVWTRGFNSSRELTRVTIPYPGTPFMVFASARVMMQITSRTSVDVRILNVANNLPVNWMREPNWDPDFSHDHVVNVAPIMWGPYTSDLTLALNCAVRGTTNSQSGFLFDYGATGQTMLSVSIFPSTVQPPEV